MCQKTEEFELTSVRQPDTDRDIIRTYRELKGSLEQAIKTAKGREVRLNEEAFFRSVTYHLVQKNRDVQCSRSIISEKRNSFTNTSSEQETQYQIKRSYVDTTSLAVITEDKHMLTVGANLGGECAGGSAGIKAEYRKGKYHRRSEGQSQAEMKELSLSGAVKPKHRVVVKEMTYEMRNKVYGKLDIIVDVKTKIPFQYQDACCCRRQRGRVKLQKLLRKKNIDGIYVDHSKGIITIHLQTEWEYRTTAHNLEFYSEKLPENDLERITAYYKPRTFTLSINNGAEQDVVGQPQTDTADDREQTSPTQPLSVTRNSRDYLPLLHNCSNNTIP